MRVDHTPHLPSRPTDSEFALFTEQARVDEADCRRAAGGLRPYVNTANTARDMDVICGALGEKKINYLGVSYGTYLGAVFGSLFSASLDRNVLDSAVKPDISWYEQTKLQAVAIRDNVDAMFTWFGERDSVYGLGKSREEVFATAEALAAKLAVTPVGSVGRDSYDLVLGVSSRYRPRWAELGEMIKRLRAASDGAVAADAPATVDAVAAAELLSGEPGIAETVNGVYTTVICEIDWPQDLSTYYTDMKLHREKYFYGEGVSRAGPKACTFRSFELPEKAVALRREGYQTGLVLQAEGDPQTRYEGGVAMATKLGHQLVSVADDGNHGLYDENACASDIVDRYLVDGVLPGTRTVCAGEPRPDVPADGEAARAPRADSGTSLTDAVRRHIAAKKPTTGGF